MSGGPTSDRALLLDVDGVLIPFGPPHDGWGDWGRHGDREDIVLSRQMVDAVQALDADVHWLTSWMHSANTILAPILDWPPMPVLEKQTLRRWWKLVAVEEFVRNAPHARIAWVDDDLDEYADEVDDAIGPLVDAGRLLLVCTDSRIGLTRTDLDRIGAFFAS